MQASIESGAFVIAGVALVVGLLTVYSMTKIWLNAFWKARPDEAGPPPVLAPQQRLLLLAPIAALAIITLDDRSLPPAPSTGWPSGPPRS